MRRLNFQVDEDGMAPEAVAEAFLLKEDLIPEKIQDPVTPDGVIRVGGKNFTEQEILGEMIGQLVEANSRLQVDRKLNLGGTMICFNALVAGDLDLYVEYTGTALVSILKKEAISDPARSFNLVRKICAQQYELIWLEPLGFNNTYTLTMRRVQSDMLGIRSISDLARFVNQAKEE
jgi:glycine betaine/choline ABC-type transport system substrate-binding protein